MQSVGGSESGLSPFFRTYGELKKNRPREQKNHVLQTLAEVRVGSAQTELQEKKKCDKLEIRMNVEERDSLIDVAERIRQNERRSSCDGTEMAADSVYARNTLGRGWTPCNRQSKAY